MRVATDDRESADPGTQHLAAVSDKHQVGIIIPKLNVYHHAIPVGGFDSDDTLAAAALHPVLVEGGAFAVTILSD